MKLSQELLEFYDVNKKNIKNRLEEFKKVPKENYFYELCFCLCTPQSKASNSLLVQNQLIKLDLQNQDLSFEEVSDILRKPENYIRFHNQKAKRLLIIKDEFHKVTELLDSNLDNFTKRNKIQETVNGFGYKEAGHFMRNIGYTNLAILDRHILKNLKIAGVFDEIPKINTAKEYHKVEQMFLDFAQQIKIPIDEIDLLFWAYENGEIIK
jgi:N-glycosylase/DNA lyase